VNARNWKATTEVTGPTDDVVRLYTREMPLPKDALISVLEDTNDNASALITFTEALRLVQGLVDYFEMTDYHVILPREDNDL
jgi:hypothetical protein